jgi:hypothetical protein
VADTNNNPGQSRNRLGFLRFGGRPEAQPLKKGDATMANNNNGNQFREDEIIILEQLRDGKMVKNIFPEDRG